MLLLSPFLKIGVTCDNFQQFGKLPVHVVNNLLNIQVKTEHIDTLHSLRIRLLTQSGPVAVLESKVFRMASTSSSSVIIVDRFRALLQVTINIRQC
jgi:hypothetical protein